MALVVIQIQDREKGADVHLSFEPQPHVLAKAQTVAQKLATVALNAIQAELANDKPRLVLVGADELPH